MGWWLLRLSAKIWALLRLSINFFQLRLTKKLKINFFCFIVTKMAVFSQERVIRLMIRVR